MKYKWDFLVVFLLSLTAPIFFFKLGQSSLVSWDEAWYAEIAKNILTTGDLFNLVWNGKAYFDHPPLGFWLMALTLKVFGISEFWVRFPSAFLGWSSLILLYFLGKELFNRVVGFSSAIALSSAPWFITRARSGNLDATLVFFFILTFFLALKASKNKNFILPFSLSLAALFLSKTLIPVTILPVLLIIFWPQIKKYQFAYFAKILLIFLVLTIPWFIFQYINQSNFLSHYLKIGFPGVSLKTSFLDNLMLAKTYLHNGIGQWFRLGILSLPLGLIFWQKKFFLFPIFFLAFLIPVTFSPELGIWHLIPLYPFLILNFFAVFYTVLQKIIPQRKFIACFLILLMFYFWFLQAKQNWYNFIDIPRYISDETILSREAIKYPYPFMIDGDFEPTAVFYSGKNVKKFSYDELVTIFEKKQKLVIITFEWRLKRANIAAEKYRIIKTDRDKILVLKE